MKNDKCFVADELLQDLVKNKLFSEQEYLLLAHSLNCRHCQQRLRPMYEAMAQEYANHPLSLSEQERNELIEVTKNLVAQIKQAKQERLKRWQVLEGLAKFNPRALAAADDQTADQKMSQAALGQPYIFLSFSACCDKDDPHFWRATIELPSAITPETELCLKFTDSKDRPIQEGEVQFCGQKQKLEDGKAYLLLENLRKHLKKQSISFAFPGKKHIAGEMELIFN